ncbi:FtsK/SpoIIIE domain-containing protein (plasmid) [Sphaerimonospora sp. CA-214678]|uniref:FtsK/SpoIIIE domain-containing protein n=1 Tax=Sphaerimonospora sp. CA-214678 TaxID=3240029 RepID=UPI003D8DFB7C
MLNFLFSAIGKLLTWLAKQLARLIAWLVVQAVLHPRTSTMAGTTAASVAVLGWQLCLTIAGAAFVGLSTWKAAHPETFGKTVETWARSWWHRWWIYRRLWREVFTRCDLTVQAGTEVYVPKLKRVRSTPYWDHLVVEMPIGQSVKRYQQEEAADALRLGFKGERLVVKGVKPRLLELSLMRRDPLVEAVPATALPASVEAIDWRRIPVGIDEFGKPYTISLLGGHTAISGSTGAGKAGLEWNILRGIAPAITAGLVRLVGIDPKAKELRRARALFGPDDYAVTDEDVLKLLERLVQEMNEANERDGAAGERDFRPGKGRPLTLVLLDEMAPLFKYWPRRIRDKIEDALGLLLTQGRAVGFIVVGAIQEPTKDVFQLRDLFTRRIALRLPTESHTEAALVENAVDYGALCHQISETTPGVLYSLQDGARSTVRARLGHVRDADIDELIAYVETSAKVVELDTWGGNARGAEIAA